MSREPQIIATETWCRLLAQEGYPADDATVARVKREYERGNVLWSTGALLIGGVALVKAQVARAA